MPHARVLLVAALALTAGLASLAPPTGAGADAVALPCEGFEIVPSQGPSCPIPGGWRVLLPDGSTVDTHGPDEAAGRNPNGGNVKSSSPACVDDPATRFHGVLVYAYPADKPNRSAEMVPVLRDVLGQVNGLFRQEAAELGAQASLKVRCDAPGTPTVLVARLPRDDANVTFSTLIGDLRAQGHKSVYAKHWVWYDGTRGTLYGQGQVYNNSKLSSANGNSRGNMFSVVWGLADPMAFAHEITHTMGGVQTDAPHSSGGFHCTDGLDVMCYRDAPDSVYTDGVCTDRVHLDCNHDDYFHPSPAPGSYLATHWNVAHPYNRVLDLGRANMVPQVQPIACVPAVVDYDQPTTCKVYVDDDSDGVSYAVSVDGAPAQRHPATGYAIAGQPLALTLRWSALGEHTVEVTATDDAKKALTSALATARVRVGCALERSGNLTGGVAGNAEETAVAWEGNVPRACEGRAYELRASLGSDADLCWHDAAGATLACATALGDERGAVPPGARSAKVYLKAGAAASYALKGW